MACTAACALLGCAAQRVDATQADVGTVWNKNNFVTGGVSRYSVMLGFGEMRISGVMMVREHDGVCKGTLMNEFGIRAFDFEVSSTGAKVWNALPMMDKWYIRQTLAADLQFLFMADDDEYLAMHERLERRSVPYGAGQRSVTLAGRKRSVTNTPDGVGDAADAVSRAVGMTNIRRGITYRLELMN